MRLLLLGLSLSLATGCSKLIVKKDQLEASKSGAIVGFTAHYDMFKDKKDDNKKGIIDAVNVGRDLAKAASGERRAKRISQAEHAYAKVSEALAKRWKLTPREALVAHDGYKAWFGTLVRSGLELSMDLGQLGFVQDIGLYNDFDRLDQAKRDKLAEALGVDLIIGFDVTYRVGDKAGFALGGVGKETFYPKAHIRMRVFKKGVKDPIWYDNMAIGPAASAGYDVTMGVITEDKLDAGIKEALDKAILVMLERLESKL